MCIISIFGRKTKKKNFDFSIAFNIFHMKIFKQREQSIVILNESYPNLPIRICISKPEGNLRDRTCFSSCNETSAMFCA